MSTSTSFDTSSSSPVVLQTPENDIEMQIANIAASLGQQVFGWAQGVFQNTSDITNQMISNYLTASQDAMQLAGNNLQRYEQVFQPMEDSLVQDAKTYASTGRIQQAMGAAEADQAAAAEASRQGLEANLQSYGIDPSSGRYASLEAANRTQAGAAEAAAGTEAALQTEATGRQLRQEAIQVGQQYPGQIANSLNSAYQGIAGAENAALGNASVGAQLQDAANPYLQTGMNLRNPPVGQNSSAFRTSNSNSPNSGQRSSGSNNGSGGGGLGGGGAYQPSGGLGGASGTNDFGDPLNSGNTAGGGPWRGGSTAEINTSNNLPGNNQPGAIDPWDATPADINSINSSGNGYVDPGNPFLANNGGQPLNGELGIYGNEAGLENTGYGTNSSYFGGGGSDYNNFSGDWGAGASYGNSNQPSGADPYSTNTPDWSSPDYSSYTDNSGGGGYTDSGGYTSGDTVTDSSDMFAAGGAIPTQPGMAGGGFVPRQMSPSGGRHTDDVPAVVNQTGQPARLNADEFVIPRDVATWKGHEFFQNLIDKSRKARMGGSAKPTMKPMQRPAQGAPR
jgi:hypothetical protein